MDETDKKRRRMSTEGESVNQDHDKQKTDSVQIVAIDNPANFNEMLSPSEIADLSSTEFKVVKTKLTFVDKSEGIKRLFKCPSSGVQISAPSGFGKSTFMNMVKMFFMIEVDADAKPISNPESSENYEMFMNLKLGQNHRHFVKKHCGQYPVIFMSLKNVQGSTVTDVLDSFKQAICGAFEEHLYLLETAPDGSKTFKNKKIWGTIRTFLNYCDKDNFPEPFEPCIMNALKFLSGILYTHFNKKVVILIDDADAPIMKAITDNMEDETLKYLMRLRMDMLSDGLKDNEFMERSLVSSSSVRPSGGYSFELNNQYHAPFLQKKYFSETFGFTEQEVHNLLENDAFQAVKDFDGVKKWYSGYQRIDKDEAPIYSGWSVIKYLSNSIEKQKKMFGTYWAKSVWLDCLKKLFVNHEIQKRINKLVKGQSIIIGIDEPTVDNILILKNMIAYPHSEMDMSQVDFFFQLLWDEGLLTAEEKYRAAVLKIPNLEIKTEIQRKCYTQSHFEIGYRLKPENIERYIKALKQLLRITTSNEEERKIEESQEETTKKCEEAMCNLVNAVSLLFSDDAAVPVSESELHHILFYLAYNDSLFVTQSHRTVVKISEEMRDSDKLKKGSNQTKGKEKRGRKIECDMCVTLGTVAVIFEFKFVKDEEAENSKTALQQIIEKTYFKLLDEEEYKHVKTKIYVGLCVKKNLNVTAHYLVNNTDLANAKNVAGGGNN